MLAFFLVFIKVACQKWKRLFHILSDIDNWACQRKKPNILTCKHKQQATPITRVVPTTYLLPTTDVYQVQSTFQIDDWVLATANFHYTISLFGGHAFIPIQNSRPTLTLISGSLHSSVVNKIPWFFSNSHPGWIFVYGCHNILVSW